MIASLWNRLWAKKRSTMANCRLCGTPGQKSAMVRRGFSEFYCSKDEMETDILQYQR